MDNSNIILKDFRSDADTWWSMTDEYFKLLSRFKKLFSDFYITKDANNLLAVVELEFLHVESNFTDKKYLSLIAEIKKGLDLSREILSKNFLGAKMDKNQHLRDLEAINILFDVMRKLYHLENDKGMLQKKPEDSMANLRKYGD